MVRTATRPQPFVENHKLEVLGLLAGGIAHDFNTILTCIIGHAQLLEMPARYPHPSLHGPQLPD